jgi:hypothetical protein
MTWTGLAVAALWFVGGSPLVPALNRAVHRAIPAGHWLVHGLGQLETIPVYIVLAVMGSRP